MSDKPSTPTDEEVIEQEIVFPVREHRYRQRGDTLYCITCPHPHGTTLPQGVKMTGEKEDGTPVLTRVW